MHGHHIPCSLPPRVCELRCSSGLTVQTTLTGKRNAADERYSPNEPRALARAHRTDPRISLFLLRAKLLPRFRDLGQCHLIRTFLCHTPSLMGRSFACISPLYHSVHWPFSLNFISMSEDRRQTELAIPGLRVI